MFKKEMSEEFVDYDEFVLGKNDKTYHDIPTSLDPSDEAFQTYVKTSATAHIIRLLDVFTSFASIKKLAFHGVYTTIIDF